MIKKGFINRIVIVAPKGAEANWIYHLIPTSWPKSIKYESMLIASNVLTTKKRTAEFNCLVYEKNKIAIIAINWDLIKTKRYKDAINRFCSRGETYFLCDESHYMKNEDSARFKALIDIRPNVKVARTATGTAVLNGAEDVYAQYAWLDNAIIGCPNIFSFKARYMQLLPKENNLYKHIAKNTKKKKLQIPVRDKAGVVQYKNLDTLRSRLEPYRYRVLKKDCIDLPEKIYAKHYFHLTKEQHDIYRRIEQDFILLIDEENDPQGLQRLACIQKLLQITSGFVLNTSTGEATEIPGENPKLELLKQRVIDLYNNRKQTIIWTVLNEEINIISDLLYSLGIRYKTYEGATSSEDRQQYVKEFQSGDIDVIVINQQAGRTAITLTAAENVLYYSNRFNLDWRSQSEDRAHRIGLKHNVVYEDFIGIGTKDEQIIESLQSKADLAAIINGDKK